jgi:hypothetical protein
VVEAATFGVDVVTDDQFSALMHVRSNNVAKMVGSISAARHKFVVIEMDVARSTRGG